MSKKHYSNPILQPFVTKLGKVFKHPGRNRYYVLIELALSADNILERAYGKQVASLVYTDYPNMEGRYTRNSIEFFEDSRFVEVCSTAPYVGQSFLFQDTGENSILEEFSEDRGVTIVKFKTVVNTRFNKTFEMELDYLFELISDGNAIPRVPVIVEEDETSDEELQGLSYEQDVISKAHQEDYKRVTEHSIPNGHVTKRPVGFNQEG